MANRSAPHLTTISATSQSPETVQSRFRLKRTQSPPVFRSGSVIIQRSPVNTFRRLASAELFNESNPSFHEKLSSRLGNNWKPRTNTSARSCKEKIVQSLRDDFKASAAVRGVLMNNKLTDEEYDDFRFCYSLLFTRSNDPGLSPKNLVKFLLECKVFPCKKEAAVFCRTLPGRTGIYISCDVLIEASSCPEFNQRNKARRFIKFLPSSEVIAKIRVS
jgi:hypothetical protein